MGPDPRIALFAITEVKIQFTIAYWISVYQSGWIVWGLACYFIGGKIKSAEIKSTISDVFACSLIVLSMKWSLVNSEQLLLTNVLTSEVT